MNRYERHLKTHPELKKPGVAPGTCMLGIELKAGDKFKLYIANSENEVWEVVRRGKYPNEDTAWARSEQRGPCGNSPDGLWSIPENMEVIAL